MDTIDPIRFLFAFVFILGLIGAMAYGLRRFGKLQQLTTGMDASNRIRIIETRFLDTKRRLVLVRKDNTEHLLLLAEGREQVIESKDVESKPYDAMMPTHTQKSA